MSLSKKIVRQNFRESVFKRDGHVCLFCTNTNDLDAHHIVDRNLMPDGGYIMSNGATLCPDHHLEAERGTITVSKIRQAIVDRQNKEPR